MFELWVYSVRKKYQCQETWICILDFHILSNQWPLKSYFLQNVWVLEMNKTDNDRECDFRSISGSHIPVIKFCYSYAETHINVIQTYSTLEHNE